MSNQLSKKSYLRDVRVFVLLVFLLPLWLWVYWLVSPKTKKSIVTIDKTVLHNYQEHNSFFWILNHEKYIKPNGEFYQPEKSYYGFFPEDSGRYRIKGLERFNPSKINQLVQDCDLTYITDTYGIYSQEWKNQTVLGDRSSLIYGGLSRQDMDFLKGMQNAGKLIITEFNTVGSPTDESIRQEFEKTFGLKWSGWNGRYFKSFDTLNNPELPNWLIKNYKRDHAQQWPFKKDGIAMVNEKDEVIILERGSALGNDVFPHIKSSIMAQEHYHIPADIVYSYWFDIMFSNQNLNEELAEYTIPVTAAGKAILDLNGLPSKFPAIILSKDKAKPFFYLSGDFTDIQIDMKTAKFSGVPIYKWMLYDKSNPLERTEFFWNFYRPLITTILKDDTKRTRAN